MKEQRAPLGAMSRFVLNEAKAAAPDFGCYATFEC